MENDGESDEQKREYTIFFFFFLGFWRSCAYTDSAGTSDEKGRI